MPEKRKWTALVYAVAKPGPDRVRDQHYLNAKADEIVQALKEAAKGFDDVYVAYRIVYDDRDQQPPYYSPEPPDYSEPVAGVLNSGSAVVRQRGWFAESHNLASDMLRFYAWALPQCPSEHLALFFWGHSMGPGGLFRPRGKVRLPAAPSLEDAAPLEVCDLRESCRKVLVGIYGGDHWDTGTILEADPTRSVTKPDGAEPRIDVVLFQSCWMSTLETAFQLKDSARYVVASQSLVPFGYPEQDTDPIRPPSPSRGRGVWPYRKLFDALRRWIPEAGAPTDLVEELKHHYQGPPMMVGDALTIPEVWPFATVPFSLLNLDAIDQEGLACKLGLLIRAIKRVNGLRVERADLMERASFAVCGSAVAIKKLPKPDLAAGSIALVDLKLLCIALLKRPGLDREHQEAIEQLRDTNLVVAPFEVVDTELPVFKPRRNGENAASAPLTRTGLGFGGVSFFYYPDKDRRDAWKERDDNIFPDLKVSQPFFSKLVLATEVEKFMRSRRWTSDWVNNVAFDQRFL